MLGHCCQTCLNWNEDTPEEDGSDDGETIISLEEAYTESPGKCIRISDGQKDNELKTDNGVLDDVDACRSICDSISGCVAF